MRIFDRRSNGFFGLLLLLVFFISLTIFSNSVFKGKLLDLTEGELFTLSDATRGVLESIDEPIKVRLFFSKILGEQSPKSCNIF